MIDPYDIEKMSDLKLPTTAKQHNGITQKNLVMPLKSVFLSIAKQ